jgi:CheY-like chemotaxis protein
MRQPPRILLVEDEPLIRMLASDMLDMLGYAVLEAANGAEALQIASEALNTVSAALIDLGLPDQPGEQVVRRLHAARPDLPVILATGADASAAAERLKGQGVIVVLEKPYQLADLQRAMAQLSKPSLAGD